MKDRKTRSEKERAEIRKLREEKNKLSEKNKVLTEELESISQSSKPTIVSQIRNKVAILYDIVVSAMILVFVYWIAINGHDNLDMPYIFFMALVIFISIKCLFSSKEFRLKMIWQVIFNDLLKPFASMLLGLFICMFCLGEGWREAQGYALDVANTGILVLMVALMVIAIVIANYICIGVIKIWGKISAKRRCRKK